MCGYMSLKRKFQKGNKEKPIARVYEHPRFQERWYSLDKEETGIILKRSSQRSKSWSLAFNQRKVRKETE